MAKRQDSGSNSSHENQRPTPQNEERLPEFTETTRGRGDDEADEADEADELDDDEIEDNEEDTF